MVATIEYGVPSKVWPYVIIYKNRMYVYLFMISVLELPGLVKALSYCTPTAVLSGSYGAYMRPPAQTATVRPLSKHATTDPVG